ncbi:uncharacterized protein LOC108193900 isoform X2 [Daucus carota subsp. sativus]|uniref:uncharacterized protein LOC108193900 isoform X2 n=1 Tax=Daucus carota subsp. sativus TaxID=79200 RepID=UPI0030835D6D
MFNVNQKGLMEQDLSNLDVITLHPLSPEVISRQATINIGTTSHLAHGKSTAVKAISEIKSWTFNTKNTQLLKVSHCQHQNLHEQPIVSL